MIMCVVQFNDPILFSDGNSQAFVKRFAAPPPGSSAEAGVVLHEAVSTNCQYTAAIFIYKRRI